MSNAVAKTKGVEISTEVVVDMFEDGAEGAVFSADDLLIPRLQLAQKMSPELDENDAKYIYEKTGIKNFLIGESLLKSDKPGELMKRLIQITQ